MTETPFGLPIIYGNHEDFDFSKLEFRLMTPEDARQIMVADATRLGQHHNGDLIEVPYTITMESVSPPLELGQKVLIGHTFDYYHEGYSIQCGDFTASCCLSRDNVDGFLKLLKDPVIEFEDEAVRLVWESDG